MGRYVIRRLLQMIPVIIGITFIIYVSVFALGDPRWAAAASGRVPPATSPSSGPTTTSTSRCCCSTCSIWATWSAATSAPTSTATAWPRSWPPGCPTTIKLALMAISIETVIGIGAGVLAGIRRGKFVDNLVTVSTLFADLHPGVRDRRPGPADLRHQARLVPGHRDPGHRSTQLIMPAFVLASVSIAYVARLMRTNLAENLRADYVRTAQGQRALARAGSSACTPCATR